MIGDKWVVRVGIAAVATLSIISCGDDNGSNPSQCDPALDGVAGNGQTAEVSTPLPDTLVVRATNCDPAGQSVPETGVLVLWAVTSGGGTVNGVLADTVLTDGDGLARAVWVLGPTEGAQTVTATALRATPNAVTFDAQATAPAAGCPPGSVQHPAAVITSDETWGAGGHVVTGNIHFGGTATLTIAAGAHVCLDGGQIEFTEESHLMVNGASGNPVTIEEGLAGSSLNFGVNILSLTTPSRISNARLEGVGITVSGGFHPVVIESTLVRDAPVLLGAPGSAFRFSTIVRERLIIHAAPGGIEIEGTVRDSPQEGIFINGQDVTLVRCEVTGSQNQGLYTAGDATTISVHSSNFFENGAEGVWNGDINQLSATGNWWGDPAGPGGPNGDGVAGSVDVSGPLVAPAVLGYRPPE